DPLSATTHFEIISECRKRGIKYEIIHSASVLTAIAETGLSLYKFGKVTSIPKPQENFKPTSFVNTLKQNQSIEAHTLFILEPELKLAEAIGILLEASSIVTLETFAIGCARLGYKDAKIAYNKLAELKTMDFGSTPHCLVIPAKLDFKEEEFINEF
ncbi:MAG: diphthine synthase, partial [Nanoarchaeota archaeon]